MQNCLHNSKNITQGDFYVTSLNFGKTRGDILMKWCFSDVLSSDLGGKTAKTLFSRTLDLKSSAQNVERYKVENLRNHHLKISNFFVVAPKNCFFFYINPIQIEPIENRNVCYHTDKNMFATFQSNILICCATDK